MHMHVDQKSSNNTFNRIPYGQNSKLPTFFSSIYLLTWDLGLVSLQIALCFDFWISKHYQRHYNMLENIIK